MVFSRIRSRLLSGFAMGKVELFETGGHKNEAIPSIASESGGRRARSVDAPKRAAATQRANSSSRSTLLPTLTPRVDSDAANGFIENREQEIRVLFGDTHGRCEADGLSPQAAFAQQESQLARVFEHL